MINQLRSSPVVPHARSPRDEATRLAALADYRLIPLGGLSETDISSHIVDDLEGLARVAARLAGSYAAVFNIISDTHQHQIAAWNIAPAVCDRQDSMCAVVFQDNATVVVPDAALDPRFVENPFVTGEIGRVRFYASTPLRSPGGEILGTLCVFDTVVRELTPEQEDGLGLLAAQAVEVLELSRRTRLLDDAVGRLTTANELLTGFAGRISHDLKAPLGVVLGFAETLSDLPAVAADPVAGRQLDRIDGACRRMSRTIADLLQFATAGGRLQVEPVDVGDLVAQVSQDLEQQIRHAAATVEMSPGAHDQVPADPTQLRMFLQNLIANSVKYRRPDVPPRVTISSQDTAQWWLVRVSDNGLGIPADQRDRVRQPMVRLDRDRSSSTEGSGIGLATCERIATAHGGLLEISDTPGGGTTFTLRAPHPEPRSPNVHQIDTKST
jgi:signal transduction histidine kinase